MPSAARLALAALLLAPAALAAQSPPTAAPERPALAPPGEPVRVMVLGTWHFDNPGLDVVKTEVADVLAPERQREVERVVESLARFRPTKIAIEALPTTRARFDSLYAAYRAGTHALSRDERQQIGFRLANRLGHPRLHPIDHGGDFPFQPLMAYAQARDTASLGFVQRAIRWVTAEENRRQRELGVIGNLRERNAPEDIAEGHAFYMRLAAIGAGDGNVGADLLSKWYDRNIRIYANLRAAAEPGDRILVIYGSGHSAILRELVRGTAGMEVVEALDFLPER